MLDLELLQELRTNLLVAIDRCHCSSILFAILEINDAFGYKRNANDNKDEYIDLPPLVDEYEKDGKNEK